ncbi:MAG TPA: mechanosensitive ion channel family protein [Gammaproteobacteria bacterium]|nr:mechanosensitive ion channel family protein [Gammaproteobacteria bacterium]
MNVFLLLFVKAIILIAGGIFLLYALLKRITNISNKNIFFILLCYLSLSLIIFSLYLEHAPLENTYLLQMNYIHTLTTFACCYTLIKFLHYFIWTGKLIKKAQLIPKIMTKIFHTLLYIITLVISVHFIFNQSIFPYLAVSGATAAFIGYLARDAVAQILGGLSINLAKNINKNEWIRIGTDGPLGKIIEMDWRSVTLRQLTGVLLIIPNTVLTSSKIYNYSARPKLITAISKLSFPGYINSQDVIITLKETFNDLKYNINHCTYYIHRKQDNYIIKISYPSTINSVRNDKSNFIETLSYNLHQKGILLDGYYDIKQQQKSKKPSDKIYTTQLQKTVIFQHINKTAANKIIKTTRIKHLPPKSIVFNPNEMTHELLVLLKGHITISYRNKYNKILHEKTFSQGEVLGLHSLINKTPEIAKFISDEESVVAILENKALEIIKKDRKTMNTLKSMLQDQEKIHSK